MADQLWQKGLPLDSRIHRFTVGNDPQTDLSLLPWDIYGTAAHVRMLAKVRLLSPAALPALLGELSRLMQEALAGRLVITVEQEDCHTAIEQALTAALGEAGQNVHLGRSRNDQVLTALRLYMRDSALQLGAQCADLAEACLQFALRWQSVRMPGYTHLRRAMPSSASLWSLSFAAALVEELQALQAVLQRLDRCPLGSGAGFGVPLPLDLEYSAELLGFSRVQRNPADAANSRGRHELALAGWISGVGNVLEKLYWDLVLYSTEEFGLVQLPDAFTTGSSIMPHKRNPDVLELCRARCAQLRAWRGEIEQLASGLPSNYHRDFQAQKEPLIRCVNGLDEVLEITVRLLAGLTLDEQRCAAACTPELYATQEAYRRVLHDGVPFREAYAAVGREVAHSGADPAWATSLAPSQPQTAGAELAAIRQDLHAVNTLLSHQREKLATVLSQLLEH